MTFINTFNKRLVVIYPILSSKQEVAVDYYLLLSFLQSNGITFECFNYDLSVQGDDYLIEFSEQFSNDLIYLYIPDVTYFSKLSNCLERLKKTHSFIIIGGFPTIKAKATEILNHFDSIDVILRTPEEEKVLVCLLKGLRENKDLESLEGIIFRQFGTGKITATPSPPLSKDLDHLHDFEFLEQEMSGNKWYPLVTSRGCNHNCQYCGLQVPYRMNYSPGTNFWRRRSVKKIVDGIERLISRGIDKFAFYNEQFFNPKEAPWASGHAAEIANEILKRKLKPRFTFIAKASELVRNFGSLYILREAGLEKVDIGIDSGLERFHQMYETGSSVQANVEILKRLHEHRFIFDISFVFFDPYLSIDEIEKNLVFLEKTSGYFSHLRLPYGAYLVSRVLKNVLILRSGMPIIQKLKQDDLVIEPPLFVSHPSIKFKDPQVEKVYSIYRIIDKSVIPSIRPFFNDKVLVEKNRSLNLFPLKIMRKIVTDVVEARVTLIPKYVMETASYLKNAFNLPGIFSSREKVPDKKMPLSGDEYFHIIHTSMF